MNYSKYDIMNKYEKIDSVMDYFTMVGSSMVFTGQTLQINIPKRYDVYQLLTIGDTITTLGVVDMIIDDKYRCGLLLLAQIEMDNTEMFEMSVDEIPYVCVRLTHGDKFIHNTVVPQNNQIVYSLFVEFITRGKLIYWLGYDDIIKLFHTAKSMCGTNIPVNQVIFEVMYSHLFRDANNLHVQYRHTDMKGAAEMIGLHSINYGTDSTTAKLMGSYFSTGLNSALINQSERRQRVEDLLRA